MASEDLFGFFNNNEPTNEKKPSVTETTLSREEIIKVMKDYDGSGLGVLTTKQCLAAMRDLPQIKMNETECQQFVQSVSNLCSDGNGKIKMEEFATQLALKIKKKNVPVKQTSNDNPFFDYPIDIGASTKPSPGLNVNVDNGDTSPSPSPRGGDTVHSPNDPSAALSIPDWYGHSLYSPTDPNTTNIDDLFGFTNEPIKKPASSPVESKASTTTTVGLIAPPRSKDQKSPRSEKKKARSPSPLPVTSFSFAVHFADGGDPMVETPMSKAKTETQKEEKEKDLDFDFGNKLVEPPTEEPPQSKSMAKKSSSPTTSTSSSTSTTDKKKPVEKQEKDTKEKTPETQSEPDSGGVKTEEKQKVRVDAVAEMKRGTAMLKYGRKGLPHFRRFQLSDDMTRLVWYSRKKSIGETSIATADMKEVLEGQQTEVFKQCTQPSLEKASFSIVYGNELQTLDLVAKSYEEAKLWTKGLRGLMKANQQGKLHKVAQILVNVDYTDITKPNYRGENDPKTPAVGYDNAELLRAVETTLEQSKKTFKLIQELMRTQEIQKNKEFDALQELVSELEQRFDNLTFALAHKTLALPSLKRDVWVLKVDVAVLHEKLQVLAKTKLHVF